MADRIKVTPDKLRTTSTSLEQRAQELQSVTAQMISLVSGISKNVWSGEANTAYLNKFKNIDSQVSKMRKNLSEQSQHLNKIASAYRMAESTNQGAPAKIKTITIS